MPCRTHGRGGRKSASTESVTENKPPRACRGVRVKRRGKSPPPRAQVRGHEKPHAVQDKTGGIGLPARFVARERRGNLRVIVAARKSREDRKISPRQMTVQVVAKAAAGQNPAYSHRKKRGHFEIEVPPSILPNRRAPVERVGLQRRVRDQVGSVTLPTPVTTGTGRPLTVSRRTRDEPVL